MVDVPLRCSCGSVQGMASNVSAKSGVRLTCYCDDCQKFAQYLGRSDILDEYGGTDIFQITPSQIKFTQGSEQLRCVRLKEKGLFRWYTECCKTPIGNTISAGMAFIGTIHNIMDDDSVRDQNLGPRRGNVHSKFAIKPIPGEKKPSSFPLGLLAKIFLKMFIWKIKGMHRPSPFFDKNGQPVVKPTVLK
ncbi:DUF6151 family protein [Candidatus Uabimicrobium amorphum]|uniref:CENP-V/GFA domain-containing protein n=1 Tax=Uabimicrobium amorphum TaxID=2596890 RepID=A0A5S9IRG5_UABAM|nr:DUF6151 family protein [Candidatus Uabimicrobium amorphum]BBM86544.1 hypothetical protein UABAM_04930 [Candidatus Uabimicrobium amorphum]